MPIHILPGIEYMQSLNIYKIEYGRKLHFIW